MDDTLHAVARVGGSLVMNGPVEPQGFVVIVPVKPPARGKSRLTGHSPARRGDMASAFALDTTSAARTTPGVVAVLAMTDDHAFAALLRSSGCAVVPDGATELNAALVQAAAEAARRWPDAHPVVLLADLPCLTPSALSGVLAALPRDRPAFVRDAHGSGTTLYAAPLDQFGPRFGRNSAAAHAEVGAVEVEAPDLRGRLDVDDADDLRAAITLGVGPHTAAALAGGQSPG